MTVSELKKGFVSIDRVKKGGQKIVYKATRPDNSVVALKVISNATDPRVLQEIEVVKKLPLKNIPRILEHGVVHDELVDEDVLYIMEEFVDGVSMRDYLSAGNKMDLTYAHKLLKTLLEIEVQLEENRILHRDINPNNIILGPDGDIYLIDFGLAKNLDGSSLTVTAAAHGPFTPGYAPHEQFTNMKLAQDVRTDLFQIGITIYEGCNGKNPFIKPNETPFQIMSRTMTMIPPSLILDGDTQGMFAQFVNMLMAKNQSQRPDTAKDAMRYLSAITPTLKLEE